MQHPEAKICSHKKFQSNRTSSSRDMAKYVEKITKKEEEKVLKMTKNSGKNCHKSETSRPNELKFPLVLDFDHWLLNVNITVVRVKCKWCGWAATLCTLDYDKKKHALFVQRAMMCFVFCYHIWSNIQNFCPQVLFWPDKAKLGHSKFHPSTRFADI